MANEITYTFIVEQGEDGGWGATCPDLPGLLLSADTREEMFANAKDVIVDYLNAMRERGYPVPVAGEHLATIAVPA